LVVSEEKTEPMVWGMARELSCSIPARMMAMVIPVVYTTLPLLQNLH
jgi:hypothetical protein